MASTAEWKEVTKQEFEEYVRAYPRPLQRDVFGACEPPLVSYNDFAVAPQWPESIVASYLTGDTPGSASYYGPPSSHRVRLPIPEPT